MWRLLASEYDISVAGGVQILTTGMEAFDRMRACQQAIKTRGATFVDRLTSRGRIPSW